MSEHTKPAGATGDHITPYDRMALPEEALIGLLAAREPHPGLVEYFGAALHAELASLARATRRRRGPAGRRVYVLPGSMGSQLGLVSRLEGKASDARAPADVEHLAGDEAGVPVGEEHHRARHVAGLA